MTTHFGRSIRKYAAALGILGLCALGAAAEEPTPYDYPSPPKASGVTTPETVIQGWTGRPRAAARVMIAKYGEPNSFDDKSLVWYKNGPWRETVVYRKAPDAILGYHGKDIVKQSIEYAVPDNKIAALKRFDTSLKFDKASGALFSTSESENLNFLALNLADEIITDKRSPEEARDFYRKTKKLSESGKSSAYMDGFVFPVAGVPLP